MRTQETFSWMYSYSVWQKQKFRAEENTARDGKTRLLKWLFAFLANLQKLEWVLI